ncbi:phosphate signaling complex protein PhoU [Mycobacterium sp. Aquia_213]|uniref:phosphate signaling complex protein PhoU n=1 Tax=Mycobacterium sp. Aquia_213 TaxID=2991728 RepID=UPI002270CB6F|nr:phosphate signaling complex protein PhoU [Mycobacterium sp. Aquia_213]WAC89248.1 phosphate signaling complex protein PhoU [Mycobacterium sp. Aquia_213]
MRTAFHEQLDSLTETLSQMCGLAGVAMEGATQALLQADLTMAEAVIASHTRLAQMRSEAEDAAFVLLALQAPVASDLRTVVGSMQSVADAERMGGLALHVGKIARRRHPDPALPEEVSGDFAEMGRIAVDLGRSARDVVRSRDPEQAAQISRDDDEMNRLHQHLFTVLKEKDWPHGVSTAVDVTLLGRFYERFADHAVEIGRRVIFQATGEAPGE